MINAPLYNTKIFSQVFKSAQDFYNQVHACDLTIDVTEANIKNLFYLLYQKYGNNPIANLDEFQWKYKVFYVIFTYGAEWQRKLEIQATLRNLSEEEIVKRGEDIFNHASNPSVAPSTSVTEELKYVDSQSVSKKKVAKLTAYQFLWEALDSNMNEWILSKFESCFTKFINPNIEFINCVPKDTEEDEEEEESL